MLRACLYAFFASDASVGVYKYGMTMKQYLDFTYNIFRTGLHAFPTRYTAFWDKIYEFG